MKNRLHDAALQGNLVEVKKLVEKEKLKINELHTDFGTPPIFFALQKGNIQVAKYLRKQGASLKTLPGIENALYFAASSRQKKVIKYIAGEPVELIKEMDDETTELHVAFVKNDMNKIKAILEKDPSQFDKKDKNFFYTIYDWAHLFSDEKSINFIRSYEGFNNSPNIQASVMRWKLSETNDKLSEDEFYPDNAVILFTLIEDQFEKIPIENRNIDDWRAMIESAGMIADKFLHLSKEESDSLSTENFQIADMYLTNAVKYIKLLEESGYPIKKVKDLLLFANTHAMIGKIPNKNEDEKRNAFNKAISYMEEIDIKSNETTIVDTLNALIMLLDLCANDNDRKLIHEKIIKYSTDNEDYNALGAISYQILNSISSLTEEECNKAIAMHKTVIKSLEKYGETDEVVNYELGYFSKHLDIFYQKINDQKNTELYQNSSQKYFNEVKTKNAYDDAMLKGGFLQLSILFKQIISDNEEDDDEVEEVEVEEMSQLQQIVKINRLMAASSSSMLKIAEDHGFKVINVKGDGNCFFRSIEHYLALPDSSFKKLNYQQLRELVAIYIDKNRQNYEAFIANDIFESKLQAWDEINISFKFAREDFTPVQKEEIEKYNQAQKNLRWNKYLSEIRNSDFWAGETMVIALCELLQVTLVILKDNASLPPRVYKPENSRSTLYLANIEGLHYQILSRDPNIKPKKDIQTSINAAQTTKFDHPKIAIDIEREIKEIEERNKIEEQKTKKQKIEHTLTQSHATLFPKKEDGEVAGVDYKNVITPTSP